MFVTRKRFIATENQLQSCRQLLAARHGELMAIRQAASAKGGIYKCILECREVAHELREQLPADQDGHSPYLFDKLALIAVRDPLPSGLLRQDVDLHRQTGAARQLRLLLRSADLA